MKINQSLTARKRGFTYAAVVITLIIVGGTLASYLHLVAHQNQQTMRSQAWNRTVAVIEAGIEEALAHLNGNAAPDEFGAFNLANMATDGWMDNGAGGWTKTNWIGDDYYGVTITQFAPGNQPGNYYPFISAEGYVKQLPTLASRSLIGPFLAVAGDDALSDGNIYVKREVLCTTTNVPAFSKGLIAKDSIDLGGNNIRTDSYDSRYPEWSDNGRYPKNDPNKQRDNGDIGCNGLVIDIGNAEIYGRAKTGPGGAVYFNPNGAVGDKAWHAAGNSGIKDGWFSDDMNVELPDIVPPFSAGLPLPGNLLNETLPNGNRADQVLPDGQYWTGTLNGKILVTGHAKLLVNSSINLTGNDGIWIQPGASLRLYMDGPTASIGGNGVVNAGVATNFFYFGTKRNSAIALGGNGEFTGIMYAPSATFTGDGGGSGTMDFCGSAVFKSVKMNGHYNFHYDEALPTVGAYRGYVITSWNEK